MNMKKLLCVVISGALLLCTTGCNMSNTGKGAAIGAGGGAAAGAGLGAIFGGGKGAAIGAAIGTAVGAGAGALIGHKMDKQKAELAQIEGAQVETVTDQNNLQAIKVTFDAGIFFNTGKSNLSKASQDALSDFATSLLENPLTDVTINGHTDNVGSRAINEKLSKERAQAVANYLIGKGVPAKRLTTNGLAYDCPVASNDTEAGRAQNRRVEIFIAANEQMVREAENGTLK
ncbi:MAG: OmpA family protein [Muribaculaceae bacterium]